MAGQSQSPWGSLALTWGGKLIAERERSNERYLYTAILDRLFAAGVQSTAHDRVDDGFSLTGRYDCTWGTASAGGSVG